VRDGRYEMVDEMVDIVISLNVIEEGREEEIIIRKRER